MATTIEQGHLTDIRPHSAQTQHEDFESLVLSCNKDGMEALQRGDRQAAIEQFKYAEAILIANQGEAANINLLAITCNNLGCYFKKVGKFHAALSYLRRALKIEIDLNTEALTLVGTHLNICAVLSKLGKHDKAVQHALSALELVETVVSKADAEKVSFDDLSVLAIAYHNLATEREFLKQYEKAATAYQRGYQVASRCLGDNNPLTLMLGRNCEAVLKKSSKRAKTVEVEDSPKDASSGLLPQIQNDQRAHAESIPMPTGSTIAQDALAWVSKAEKSQKSAISKEDQPWYDFADSISMESLQAPQQASETMPVGRHKLPAQAQAALNRTHPQTFAAPSLSDTIHAEISAQLDVTMKPSDQLQQYRSPVMKTLDNHPTALIDIMEAVRGGRMQQCSSDCRPNRVMKGSTRTSRIVRSTAMFNSTKFRDEVMTSKKKESKLQSENLRHIAAVKIQRIWREWYAYCQENSDWLSATWICATMIQCNWRAYQVRRKKWDRAASEIQRHVRGHIVRQTLVHHTAAVCIQRHVIGMLARKKLNHMHEAAAKLQAAVRGGHGRNRVRERRERLHVASIDLQCAFRCLHARRHAKQRREKQMKIERTVMAVTRIQKSFRGWKGRRRADCRKEDYMKDFHRHTAAAKLQALWRREQATKYVDEVRSTKLARMDHAATYVQKMWRGTMKRRKYQDLLAELSSREDSVVTIQRITRGFLLRLRLWHECVTVEEQVWAAIQIQRVWRGYCGRVRHENKYESMWRREMAAFLLQRHIRGWVARAKVGRIRRGIARKEFIRSRLRYRGAQRIQALVRGVQARSVVIQKIERRRAAAIHIQRIARGHAERCRLWDQVLELRATMLAAHIRGFLVRRRRRRLLAAVILIQRTVRAWQDQSLEVRERAFDRMRERKAKARKIQLAFRKHAEKKQINCLKHVLPL